MKELQSQKNLEILQDWFKKAINAESLEEWVKSIEELIQEQTNRQKQKFLDKNHMNATIFL